MQPNKIKFKILLESAVLANNLITRNFANAVSGAGTLEEGRFNFRPPPEILLGKYVS